MNIQQVEENILAGLKDFQRATVERVSELFTTGQSRVLVADEVGLGKTMIARGVIAKMARYHQEELNDDLFKVVYVCSNLNIAGQNLNKLKVNSNVKVENSSDTRLSMQHLKIFENKYDTKLKQSYIQLIPLTPSTSFNITSGSGSYKERALTLTILQKCEALQPYVEELSNLLQNQVNNWGSITSDYRQQVEQCDVNNNGEYVKVILEKVNTYFHENDSVLQDVISVCEHIRSNEAIGSERNRIIHRLRKMMAEISVDLIKPDLVIMDEFQRFREIIDSDSESETAFLAKKFFNLYQENGEKVKILLLSAIPYKLYSTSEEIY